MYKRGEIYTMHPLDKLQENMNQWRKQILFGSGTHSWRQNSPNVARILMCINFEYVEFVKSQLEYSAGLKHNVKHYSCKQIVPTLLSKRERSYKCVLAIFEKEVEDRKCCYKDGIDMKQGMKSKLPIPVNTNNNYDGLDKYIISMFGESDEQENTELEIHGDYKNIPESSADTNPNKNDSEASINYDTVDKTILGDVFKQGRRKMIEMKIPMVKERKQEKT